jgi:glycosyltransferase involved in cell wall biosynthesis
MKIALVCPASLPATQFGGILFLCVDIARELSKKGHQISIYTTDLDFANNANTFSKNLPRIEKINQFYIKRSHVWIAFKLFFFNPSMFFQMRKDNFDIIHSIGVRSFQSFIAALIARQKNIPFVISDQGGLTTHPDIIMGKFINKLIYRLQSPIIKFIINQATKIIVANEYEKNIFLEFTREDKISIVKNGINLEDFNKPIVDFRKKYSISEEYILFVGRFHTVKGVDVLIKAVNEIRDFLKLKNMKCVIMGVDFGYEQEMFNLIKKHNLENQIIVIKKPPREYLIAAYEQSQMLVLPSRWELSPLTPLEGFAFKKPVISTNCHGIPHTIQNGQNCILTEMGDFKKIAESIEYLINNENERKEMGEEGYNQVKNECNSANMVNRIEEIYQKLIK